MSDLLPCPFDGYAPEREVMWNVEYVRCPQDGCPGHNWSHVVLWNHRAHLATETAAIQKVRDEMLAEVHSDEAECITNEYLCGCHRLRPYIAALDVILEGRKK